MQLDQSKVETFVGTVVGDLAAAFSGVLVNLGHKLGLYRAMADAGPLTPAELAQKTGTAERYVREWLGNQLAGGYVERDPRRDTYSLSPEQAFVLADPDSPVFVPPAFDIASSVWLDEDKVAAAFRSGDGLGWHEHHPRLFSGTEAFFRPGYAQNLTSAWLPALEGVVAKLEAGAKVADVGCGHGASTILMADAFPRSTFVGSDYHEASIATARRRASDAKVTDRVRFEVAKATDFSGSGYDLVCFMDCFHDLGDPVGAARHVREALAPDGTVLLVEPFAGDRVEENRNAVGRLFYAASTALCVPNSLSQEVGTALGAQAGEARLTAILHEAGFRRVRRAAETPFNLVLEARP